MPGATKKTVVRPSAALATSRRTARPIRWTDDELREVLSRAAAARLTFSEYVRRAALRPQ